jgi:methanogenic corrinoid protein MtbC1
MLGGCIMNKEIYKKFLNFIELEDKDNALILILDLLKNGTKVKDVYEYLIIPALKDYECLNKNEIFCVWKEHTRTSIIRTILESTYEFIIKERDTQVNKSIVVFCPQEEYHEIGAIIAANYFSLLGFKAQYIGANTPKFDVISAIKVINPDYVAISVTNYFNIVVTKRVVEEIKTNFPNLKIIVGGQAFKNEDVLKQVDFDYHLDTYTDILKFREEVEQ